MQDRVSLYPGRVKLEPVAGQANLYDLTRADQPTQEGTPLNKASLLKDTTAALLGLPNTAVPDDALSLLSRFQKGLGNEYVWAKGQYSPNFNYIELTDYGVSSKDGLNWKYSSEYKIENGAMVLVSYETVTLTSITGSDLLKGKYCTTNADGIDISMLYIPPDAVFTTGSESYYVDVDKATNVKYVGMSFAFLDYVNSPNSNAYPIDDGYTYIPFGQLGGFAKVETGSYTGTGTYGSSNPNSLTFEFIPKVVIVYDGKEVAPYLGNLAILTKAFGIAGSTYFSDKTSYGYAGFYGLSVKTNLNTISWSSVRGVSVQLNSSGQTYDYIAIG